MNTPELFLRTETILGEGPIWDDRNNKIYWVDILGKQIYSADITSKSVEKVSTGEKVGCMALTEEDRIIAGLETGFYFIDMETGNREKIIDPEPLVPENRINDGKCDPNGRFWAGTSLEILDSEYKVNEEYIPKGALYCMSGDYKIEKKISNVTISNGIAWSMDNKTMYYIDTPTKRVDAFDYNLKTGDIKNVRTVVNIPDGMGAPDGMSIDEEGMLWICLWEGWCVTRWDPKTGLMVLKVEIPVSKVAACTFGGKDLDILFITTARSKNDKIKQPDAGSIFCFEPGVSGAISHRFKERKN